MFARRDQAMNTYLLISFFISPNVKSTLRSSTIKCLYRHMDLYGFSLGFTALLMRIGLIFATLFHVTSPKRRAATVLMLGYICAPISYAYFSTDQLGLWLDFGYMSYFYSMGVTPIGKRVPMFRPGMTTESPVLVFG